MRDENTGLVSSGVNLTSWGEGSFLVMAGQPSSNGVTIKIPYGVDVLLHQPCFITLHPLFHIWLVKTEYDFIVISVETGLGR